MAPPRPPGPAAPPEPEALIEEARRRARRRRARIAAAALLGAAIGLAALIGFGRDDGTGLTGAQPARRPEATATRGAGRIALVYAERAHLSRAPLEEAIGQPIGLETETFDIWRARADGTHRAVVATGESPALSPDGRRIAFVRLSPGSRGSDLLVIDARGGQAQVVLHTAQGLFAQPVWAPDSRHVAVVDEIRGGLTVVDSTSGAHTVVARPVGGASGPTFSPDSSRIVYARGGGLHVYSVPARMTRRIARTLDAYAPVWGPRWIAYDHDRDVWLVRPDGTGAHRLTHTGASIVPVAWSADGLRLLAQNPAVHNGRLWAVDVPSGRARDLTGWVGDLFPQGLSRDGTTILAGLGCGGLATLFGEVETIPFAGGRPRVIARGPCRASWNR